MHRPNRRSLGLGLAAVAALAVAGCGSSSTGGTASGATTTTAAASPSATPSCSPSALKTYAAGVLTVATDSPAYEPWFSDDKPTNGKGFESAVAYAVAKQLGYSTSQVKWTVAAFDSAITSGPKKFDFDVNEVSITADRAKAVDFSSGYYDVAQAVISLKADKYAKATSLAGLKGAKLGAQKGTTSLDAITDQIKPGTTPAEYPTNDLAVQALKNGTIDGLVVDLPTGFYITSAELDNSTIVGQLPIVGQPEQFGLLLDHGSSLTSCVTQAVTTLRGNGTLAALQKQWLTDSAGAPVLK